MRKKEREKEKQGRPIKLLPYMLVKLAWYRLKNDDR